MMLADVIFKEQRDLLQINDLTLENYFFKCQKFIATFKDEFFFTSLSWPIRYNYKNIFLNAQKNRDDVIFISKLLNFR